MMPHPNMNMGPPSMQMGPPMGGGGGGPPMGGSNFSYSTAERSQRSVFVGNIPYEATEEDLKELFSQVGPVVGFRLVLDRETGKSKGYGFCEYLDQETAASALRNLNGYEFHGRNLRIDTAAGDRSKEELRQLQMTFGAPQEESPYGPPVEPSKAPEAIGRAVASLPPEQMFELMKQMKLCIQTNPNEARNMLLQNPQLAYALLQAQVVMRIVDPQVAMTMLHREMDPTAPIMPQNMGPPIVGGAPGGPGGPGMIGSVMGGLLRPPAPGAGNAPMNVGDMDYRSGFTGGGGQNFMGMAAGGGFMPGPQGQPMPPPQPPQNRPPFPGPGSILDRQPLAPPSAGPSRPPNPVAAPGGDDQEKAALIMQVLQLTDDQIAMLPPDQKQSVLLLREQLRSSKR